MNEPAESLEPLGDTRDAAALARLADDRFVHALLASEERRDALDRRVARVAAALSRPARRPHVRLVVSGGLAAAALVAVLVTLATPGAAMADFDRVLRAVARLDQTFVIEVAPEPDSRRERWSSRSLARPWPPRDFRRRTETRRLWARPDRSRVVREALRARLFLGPAGLDGGTLYVRGDRYVLVRPLGPIDFVQGFDGEAEWRVHPRRGAEEGLGPESTRLPEEVSALLFVDVVDLLETVAKEFDVTDHGVEPGLASGAEDAGAIRRFSATRRRGSSRGPNDLELFVEDETGLPVELYFGGLRAGRDPRARYELRLRLVDTEPLPADWFTPAAHGG